MQTSDLELIENYKKLKKQIEISIAKSAKESDLTKAKDYLIESQNLFKNFKLKHDNREELWQLIQFAFEEWHKRRNVQNQSFENEAYANYITLKKKVEETLLEIENITDNYLVKEKLRDVQAQFKGLKLLHDKREELYSKIQKAFDSVNFKIEQQKNNFVNQASLSYSKLSTQVPETILTALKLDDFIAAKELLKTEQTNIRNTILTKEQRDKLTTEIQKAFDEINSKIESAVKQRENLSLNSYEYFIDQLAEIEKKINSSTEIKPEREELKNLQNEITKANLLHQHRNELWNTIQELFERVNKSIEKGKIKADTDLETNYLNLKKQVDEAYHQAKTSTEYKHTKNFIMSVQKEFKGLRLRPEDRNELWTKISNAFDLITSRIDDYYRNKRGDWDVKMQTKIYASHKQKDDLEKDNIRKRTQLRSLIDQLSILKMRGDSKQLIEITENKISDIERLIEKQRIEIEILTKNIENFETEIDEPEE